MLLTEEEARGKWCPATRIAVANSGFTLIANRITDAELKALEKGERVPDQRGAKGFGNCIASACMAWRWGYIAETKTDDPNGLPAEDPRTGCDLRYIGENSKRRFLPRKGFCGLAGNMHPLPMSDGY
jgi:hypothetical protein